jgi:adenylate cyclase
MPPQTLIQLLNEYFTPMTRIIMAHQGTLDKYIGDALMALWGAPVPVPDHALQACQAVLEMEKTMAELQKKWGAQGLPRLAARFGLHTGRVVAGNVGSRERFDYTVLGDTVNLASRLEGVNKVYGTRVLLSEETAGRVQDRLLLREVDLVQVKGRGQPVAIYELMGLLPAAGPPAWLASFAEGLRAYRWRQWQEASRAFAEVLQLKPGDRPAQVFLERCRSLAGAPPPPGWQGVFVLDSK